MQFKLMLFTKSVFRTAVFILLCCFSTAAAGFAQVTLALKNTPLTKVFKEIQKQSGYEFLANYEMLEKAGNVSINVNKVSAKEAVELSLKGKGLGYELKHKVFVITPLAAPAKANTPVSQLTIEGRVVDEKSEPLPGATIVLTELRRSVSANENGKFVLAEAQVGHHLQISCIGYETKTVTIQDSKPLLIVLQESTQKLKEVVLVGYGQQKKINLTGSISTVTDKELNENRSSPAVSDMLAGRISGLYVQKSSGAPGAGSDLKIRGLSTFNNSSPLVVVDGIPGRNIDDLNPADIQAVSVLKDAAAIAVYGARASNGVILVTTKKGLPGKPEITFASNLINQVPTQVYKRVNSYEYAMIQNEALRNEQSYNPALGMGYTPEQLQFFKDGSDPNRYPNTDWFKTLTKSSVLQANYNLSASGGNEDTRYFVSVGYVKNDGIVPIEAYKRWNLRSNLSATITPRLKLDLNLAGIFVKQDGQDLYGGSYIMKQIYGTPPIRANQFSNGLYAQVPEQRGNAYLQSIGRGGFNTLSSNTFNSTLSLQYELPGIKGLFAKGTAAYDKGYSFGKSFTVPYDVYTINSAGNYAKAASSPTSPALSESFGQPQALTLEGSLRYEQEYGAHHVSGLLLYTQTASTQNNFSTQRREFVSGTLPELNLGDPTQTSNSGTGSQSARQGLVGRLTYDYNSRYLLEVNFRYDGSDIFPPGHRFGFFPSFSGGWVLSEEPFYKELVKGLDFVKIRGSWGQLGNDRVAPYQFLSTYNLVGSPYYGGGYTFGGANPVFYKSLQTGVLPNPSFTWERAVMTNIGLEAHFKGKLLTLEFDYFRKRTKDILAAPALQVPSVIGLGLPDYNNGIVDNSGLEITLGHNNTLGNFSYYVQGNVSFNHNKIVSFPESMSTPAWQKITGTSVASYSVVDPLVGRLGYRSKGLYQNAAGISSGATPLYNTVAPGDINYVDVDNDGVISPNDRVVLGERFFPGTQYGVRFGGSYKGLELNVLMQGSGNVEAYNSTVNSRVGLSGSSQLLEHWTPENTNAGFPRLWSNYQNNAEVSDYWIVNASYLRLKNIELAYNFPKAMLQKIGVKGLKISVSGNNLLTFTNFKLFDPEAAGQITDPLMKSYAAGISLQL
ncbi:SusC/RagA family TonB-linked outer membrane protein [Pedobacter caeni]|uniref:TonB-linked outer membrane protein, SusC/RagA family n=1 Tax=Pedobacter caeni TaxID=288992 RepID=A0A1M4UFG2_9SPHI|nr:TonB-dependent receptor [Pedobacter caeni]SHE55435.1 TonB-linked outer membrane protein, SusC/RagA family [Pedobacter caeni]